jgi:ubiquinone/menaquinone biosynthesis C-methylase UbiE
MREHGLRPGATCIDVGAGTGLMLSHLSGLVGPSGRVLAVDLSHKFCEFLRRRVPRESLPNVTVQQCTAKSVEVAASVADFACLLDVYHHLEYPVTFMRSVRSALADGAKLILVDFHRDPSKVTSHPPSWALDHIRADQSTFRSEVEKAGFKLVASPEIEQLKENYIMIFEKA